MTTRSNNKKTPVLKDIDDTFWVSVPDEMGLSQTPTLSDGGTPASIATSSGEYNAFATLGAISARGGKRALWFSDDMEVEKPCLGFVGTSEKACCKRLVGSAFSCGTAKHEGAKFRPPKGYVFLRASDTTILTEPSFKIDDFSAQQVAEIRSMRLTQREWMDFLTRMVVEDESPDKTNIKKSGEIPVLLSPKHSEEHVGIFSVVPSLSFDSSTSGDTAATEDILALDEGTAHTVSVRLRSLASKFRQVKKAWSKPFMDIEASYLSMVKDIKTLGEQMRECQQTVGCARNDKKPFQNTLWEAFFSMDDSVETVREAQTVLSDEITRCKTFLDRARVDISYLNDSQTNNDERLDALEVGFNGFTQRFAKLRPMVEQWMAGRRFDSANDDRGSLGARLLKLEAILSEKEWPMSDVPDMRLLQDQVNALEAIIRDQAAVIQVLENRVVGSGVQMGDFVFQSFDDLHVWTRKNIPTGRFGFIVDAHSFLEFFTLAGHIDTELVAAAEHNAEKAGYATFYEMKVGASFSNLFPLIFGKTGGTGVDTSLGLPGVTSGDKWTHPTTGIHAQVMRKMNDISHQFDMNIRQVYKDYPEARKLANDCVTASKRFIIDFFNFVSSEYQVWQQRGFSKKDAWEIMCQLVRRIFEDLETSRISARHSRDKNNMDFTTTTIIMATLKCHSVMHHYVQHQFHEHPAISSVITRHIAANFVKPDTSPDSKFSDLERKIKGLSTKVDQLDTQCKKLEKNGK